MMTLPALLGGFWGAILAYVFFYPVLMSLFWMIGGISFYLRFERHPHRIVSQPPERQDYPLIAVLVPCYNEETNVEETIGALMELHYPNYEIIAINDGSKDRTGELLNALAARFPRLRVIHQVANQGKAVGLNTAALLTPAEILVGIDGDAILDPWSLHWLVRHFDEPGVAAVTGNPRVRNRSTLLGRIQVGEFSSVVGLIKRAQRSVDLIFTVSGVVTAFRRSALHEVGYWTPEMLTEDVDISWKLQMAGWEVRFEPRALCWILMPETLGGLWKQRLRWSMGGTQVLLAYMPRLLQPGFARLWPLCIEYGMSILWAMLFAMLAVYRVIDLIFYKADLQSVPVLLIGWAGLLIGTTCLLQLLLSMFLDRPYDRGLAKNFFWMIWYPMIYWILSAATAVAAVPRILFRNTEKRARWISPDRGIKPDTKP
jgi:biofilm PGA synthesis N-glycosyltransferase PgaC